MNNLPSSRVTSLALKFHRLKIQIAELELEAMEVREELLKLTGEGSYQNVTVYKVRKHRVPGYTVPEYTAVRANKTS